MRLQPLAELPDASPEQGLPGEGDLEPVVLGRVVAPGDHDPAPDLPRREVEERGRQPAHVHDGDPAREQAACERIAEPRSGQASVPPDGDAGLPVLARLAGDGPSDGVDQLRAQRVRSDAADVVGAKDLRGDAAVAGSSGGRGCGGG